MNALEQIIAGEIREQGPVTFARFMELALYHPRHGYYCSEKEKLGFSGDFVTSCTLTPAFGHAIAAQLAEIWRQSGMVDFTIVEYGAGTGALARSILDQFGREQDLRGRLRYVIIEISPSLRALQRSALGEEVEWVDDIRALDDFSGIVLSNELLDNFPVHKVWMQDQLMEVMVDYDNGFREVKIPAGERLRRYFSDLRVSLPQGFRTEACLAAEPWIEAICASMKQGVVITIDYGYLAGELFSERFSQGTLVSYNRHRVVQDVLADVGNQDITSHVNFSALALFGHNNGLQLTGFREQGAFLTALGFGGRLQAMRDASAEPSAARRESSIMHTVVGEMGKKFKVLAMQKGLPPMRLTGFSGDVSA